MSLRHLHGLVLVLAVAVASVAAGSAAAPASADGCVLPSTVQAFSAFGDSSAYFVAPGGDFESTLPNWSSGGGAGIASSNEIYDVVKAGSHSLALPTTSSSMTTATFCVTSDAPTFRMFVKNNGNSGMIDGQLAVYLNFTGADGRPQQVKIAGLTVNSTKWTLSPKISFIQYISTPLQSGYANVSFTLKPNDNHGSWLVDDIYVDPYHSR